MSRISNVTSFHPQKTNGLREQSKFFSSISITRRGYCSN